MLQVHAVHTLFRQPNYHTYWYIPWKPVDKTVNEASQLEPGKIEQLVGSATTRKTPTKTGSSIFLKSIINFAISDDQQLGAWNSIRPVFQ